MYYTRVLQCSSVTCVAVLLALQGCMYCSVASWVLHMRVLQCWVQCYMCCMCYMRCCNVECSVACVAVLQCCMILIVLHVLHVLECWVLQCCSVALLHAFECWVLQCCTVASVAVQVACVQFIVLQLLQLMCYSSVEVFQCCMIVICAGILSIIGASLHEWAPH